MSLRSWTVGCRPALRRCSTHFVQQPQLGSLYTVIVVGAPIVLAWLASGSSALSAAPLPRVRATVAINARRVITGSFICSPALLRVGVAMSRWCSKLASSCTRVDCGASGRRSSGATFHADALVPQVGDQPSRPAAVEVRVAEDATASRADASLHQVHAPAAAVTIGADGGR